MTVEYSLLIRINGGDIMIVEYSLLRGKAPTRSNPSDAGLDLYWNPEIGVEEGQATIYPGESVVLRTGIKIAVPHGYMFEIKNRSSVAAKKSLLVGACVVDSGYEGEVFVNLHNVGSKPRDLKVGDKIAQGVLVPVVHFRPRAVEEKDLFNDPITISNRGEGALGSTDEKQ